MWHIKSDGKKCTQKIIYGEAPSGFNQVVPAKPLQQGETYQFVAQAWGSTGWKEFSIP